MPGKLAIVLLSGSPARLLQAALLVSAASSRGVPVRVFVSGEAIPFFTRSPPRGEPRGLEARILEGAARLGLGEWRSLLASSKRAGDVRVYVCSAVASMLGVGREDLDPVVDDMVGPNVFLAEAGDAAILTL